MRGRVDYSSSTVKSVSCIPSGARKRTFRCRHGVSTGPPSTSAPRSLSRLALAALSSTSSARRTWTGDAPADLDLVDRARMVVVDELDRCSARLEEDAVAAFGLPDLDRLQAERVAIERDACFEVGDRQGQPQLAYRAHVVVNAVPR